MQHIVSTHANGLWMHVPLPTTVLDANDLCYRTQWGVALRLPTCSCDRSPSAAEGGVLGSNTTVDSTTCRKYLKFKHHLLSWGQQTAAAAGMSVFRVHASRTWQTRGSCNRGGEGGNGVYLVALGDAGARPNPAPGSSSRLPTHQACPTSDGPGEHPPPRAADPGPHH